MLLFILIGLVVWTFIVLCAVALCVQAARADRQAAAPTVACDGQRRQRRSARPACQRLRPIAYGP